jgi:acetylornithine deacetylase/succinyl-diaminopimelate desuccinylase-like protein
MGPTSPTRSAAARVTDVVELTRTLIRFDTTNPPGDEGECIAHVEQLVAAAGAETRLVARSETRPNLVARVRGDGSARPLLLYGHADVVTTEGQQWAHPPFAGELVDDVVWGRGAVDMKGGVAMLVDVFTRAARGEIRPRGDVILCVVSDEEGGGDLGARFLVERHPELFEGVRHAIGEFGGFCQHIGGRRIYPIQVAEKAACWLHGTIRGPGGHGARPQLGGTTARLGRLLCALDGSRTPVHVTPVAERFIRDVARVVPAARAALLRGLLVPRLAPSILRALRREDQETFAPILRNTVTPTIVRGGTKVNVVPSTIEVELDGRLLPGYGPEDLIAEIEALTGPEIDLEVSRHDPCPAEPDLSWLEGLVTILRELDPGCVPVPRLTPGVTDGRFFARLGIQTYGFLPLRLPPGFEILPLIHGADERVPADAIRFGAEAVRRAVASYA